jgi:dolichol-phosphate mannosyltransferase
MISGTESPTLMPQLSIVMPAYNEEEIIEYTIHRLLGAFAKAGYRLEIVAVDNGSRDRTGEIISRLAAESDGAVVHHRVEVNQGYGFGALNGITRCSAPWIGFIPADGQVDAEDVVRLFEAVMATDGWVVGKVRRRFRMDGVLRKVVSVSFNLFTRMLWPRLQTLDVNGNPKILSRALLQSMRLTSREWFLDAEMIIKAHYLGARVIELNVFARMRGAGLSHVRAATCWQFIRNLVAYRLSRDISRWRSEVGHSPRAVAAASASGRQSPSGR